MKKWKSMLAMVLSAAMVIAFGITGCGDDDDDGSADTLCHETCSRMYSCREFFAPPIDEFDVQDCTDDCNSDPNKPEALCAFDCDRTASCPDYAQCITECGVL